MDEVIEGVCCALCNHFETSRCPLGSMNNWSRNRDFCSGFVDRKTGLDAIEIISMKIKKTKKEGIQNPELYRAELSCRIGKDVLEGKKPISNLPEGDFVMFNLLSAVEDLVKYFKKKRRGGLKWNLE